MAAGDAIAGKSDGGGLTFTLSGAGTASWVLRYRHAGKQREMTLGNYPDLSLDKAREAARAARVMVDLGKDVAGEKRRAKAEASAARTFRQEEYIAGVKSTLAENTVKEWNRYVEKDIFPHIGSIAIRDVSTDDVRLLITRIATRSQSVARRAFEIISVVLTHAVADGGRSDNPCAALKISALVGKRAPVRQRLKLDRDELLDVLVGPFDL